jgi:hypothetical protein
LHDVQSRVVNRAKEWWSVFEQWTELRNASPDDRATVLKTAYEAGTIDTVYEHRYDKNISWQGHYVRGPIQANVATEHAIGAWLRHDAERRVIVGTCSSDEGAVGLSFLQLIGLSLAPCTNLCCDPSLVNSRPEHIGRNGSLLDQ